MTTDLDLSEITERAARSYSGERPGQSCTDVRDLLAEVKRLRTELDAAQREETVTDDCHRCRHWTPAQRKWHHCIHCDGTGQVPAQQEENTR